MKKSDFEKDVDGSLYAPRVICPLRKEPCRQDCAAFCSFDDVACCAVVEGLKALFLAMRKDV
jgi:hypothetical protein